MAAALLARAEGAGVTIAGRAQEKCIPADWELGQVHTVEMIDTGLRRVDHLLVSARTGQGAITWTAVSRRAPAPGP